MRIIFHHRGRRGHREKNKILRVLCVLCGELIKDRMEKNAKIYVAGHRGLVGSAIWKNLQDKGYTNLVGRTQIGRASCRERV